MITVISGTNNKGSRTKSVAHTVYNMLKESMDAKDVSFIALDEMDTGWYNTEMYKDYSKNFPEIQKDVLAPSEKFIFVFPEYNGSFPGVLKMMIDACDLKSCFHHKAAAMIGVAAGRAGNLRGMDHLTNVMHHIKVNVMPHKLPISSVHTLMNEEGEINDENTLSAIQSLIDDFIKF